VSLRSILHGILKRKGSVIGTSELPCDAKLIGYKYSQQPTANSQQPTANSQQPTANSQQPTANISIVLEISD
jgi:hypothetical protein